MTPSFFQSFVLGHNLVIFVENSFFDTLLLLPSNRFIIAMAKTIFWLEVYGMETYGIPCISNHKNHIAFRSQCCEHRKTIIFVCTVSYIIFVYLHVRGVFQNHIDWHSWRAHRHIKMHFSLFLLHQFWRRLKKIYQYQRKSLAIWIAQLAHSDKWQLYSTE